MRKAKASGAVPHTPISAKTPLFSAVAPLLPLLATGLVTAAATLFLVSALMPATSARPTLVVFDVDAAMAQFVALPDIAALASDEAQFATAVRTFHTRLDAEMTRFAKDQNALLISSNILLAGEAPDVTSTLLERVLRAAPPIAVGGN